jgi:dihydroorotate dehydrogenase electron transfer subunit
MIWLPGIEERPYSLMSGDPASLTVAEVGPFSVALCALKPGDRLWLRGPFGRGFRPHGRRHLLLGGGSGVAPLAFFAERAIQQKHEATAVIGARTAELLMLRWRFKELGCRVLLATDDGTLGIAGTVLDAAGDLLLTAWPEAVYACGPEPMLRAVALRAEELRLPCWVSMERVMKCGLGVCGSCYCGDRLVCVDGPVFSGSELLRALEPA